MSMLTISSLNAQGCSDSLKRASLFAYLKLKVSSDVHVLQDTHTTLQSESLWKLMWRGQVRFSHLSSSEAGLAVLLKPKSSLNFMDFIELIKGRAIYCKLSIHSCVFHVFVIYAPTCDKARKAFFSEILQFFEGLQFGDEQSY